MPWQAYSLPTQTHKLMKWSMWEVNGLEAAVGQPVASWHQKW